MKAMVLSSRSIDAARSPKTTCTPLSILMILSGKLATFKRVRVYCRHCLRIYAQRYVGIVWISKRGTAGGIDIRKIRRAVALKAAAKTKAEDRKRKNAETHWSGQSTSNRTRETWTRAEDRKLCRGLVRSCRGGLSVTPAIASKALRVRLFASFKRVRVYCRHCLRIYAHGLLMSEAKRGTAGGGGGCADMHPC